MVHLTLAAVALLAGTVSSSTTGFLGGVNLAGFDFGMTVWGWARGYQAPPVSQIAHFASQGVNIFRVPVGWQYLEKTPGGGLEADFFATYNAYIQAALKAKTSPYVIIDLHNYARWNGEVIGDDGPTSAQFAEVWGALGKKYASNSKIMFGLMNEPHNLDIYAFTNSLQAAVNAIRAAGAKTQYILLPGTDYSHASSFLQTNKYALNTITDPAGGTDLLVYDFHQYLDSDGSGTQTLCTTDGVTDVWTPVAADLRRSNRTALVSEVGGSSDPSCQEYLNSALAYIEANSDVYLGYTVWSAGSFNTSYVLSVTPTGKTDTVIWNAAVRPNLPSAANTRRPLAIRTARESQV